MRRNGLGLALIIILLFALVPAQTTAAPVPPDSTKILVQASDAETLAQLKRSGATQLADYGAFSLWRVPQTQQAAFVGRDSVTPATDFDTIYLRNGVLDTTKTPPPVAANARQTKVGGPQFWIVQFVGPIKPDWLDGLRADGLAIVQYLPNNAYVVWGDGGQITALERSVQTNAARQFTAEYHPAYRLAPNLATPPKGASLPDPVPVVVQFYNHANVDASVAAVTALGGGKLLRGRETILNFVNLTLAVPQSELLNIASRADVFNVELFTPPTLNDEVQGQILAGNLTTSGGNVVPTGPGYLAWLAAKGFPTDPMQYPLAMVMDDGVDNGTTTPLHPDFHVNGDGASASRLTAVINCTANLAADGLDGHGNINAGIVGSYNNRSGSPHQDANGYRLGLGVSPYGRVGNEKIFANGGAFDESACSGTAAETVRRSYAAGAALASNSWGANVLGAYNSSSQAYDALTRDADSGTAGDQDMLHVFSAGNAGSGGQTIGSPGTAKNVLTVGATQNVRDNGITDGCGVSLDNNADAAADFSSRGPTADGRAKPDITAPGVHIQGPASQDPGYNGSGVCNKYYPAGQTLYAWSSGTSHSAPAVSGAASLVYNYYGRVLAPGQIPSPAMLKALLLNTPRYLNSIGTGGDLPQIAQGWGDVNLGALFDGTPRLLTDESQVFTTTGQTYSRYGSVYDNNRPTRITLVYTDAPGATTGAAYVNSLTLTVSVGGQTYKANVFKGGTSITGGAADAKNNVQNVFLPAGMNGPFTVTVTAANIAAKAIPHLSGSVNQDFALVIANATDAPAAGTPVVTTNSFTVDDTTGGNGNGAIDPGETIALNLPLRNAGNATASGISVTLASNTPTATILEARRSYPVLPAGGAFTPASSPFLLKISPMHPCNTPISLAVTLSYPNGLSNIFSVTLPTGPVAGTNYSGGTGLPLAIPDNTPAGVTSTIAIGTTGVVSNVRVHMDITHTFDGDLTMQLTAPNGTSVPLATRRGGGGDNFVGTIFDDAATTAISVGTAPFTGSFRPETPLAGIAGSPINGAWVLKVADLAPADVGTLTAWSLDIVSQAQACVTYTPPAVTLTALSTTSGPLAGGNTVTFTGTGFTAGMTVKFGTATATVGAVTMGGTSAAVTVPMGAALGATVDVSVAVGVGAPATLPQAYEYVAAQPAPQPTLPHPFQATSSAPPAGISATHVAAPTVAGATPIPIPVRH